MSQNPGGIKNFCHVLGSKAKRAGHDVKALMHSSTSSIVRTAKYFSRSDYRRSLIIQEIPIVFNCLHCKKKFLVGIIGNP